MTNDASSKGKVLTALGVAAVAGGAALATWWFALRGDSDQALFATNGRIEAVEVHVATKLPGRVEEVLVKEGDKVAVGDAVARIDAATLEARLQQALAEVERAKGATAQARSQIALRESECALAENELSRAERLHGQGHVSEDELDRRRTGVDTVQAACRAAEADLTQAVASGE